MLKWVLIRRKNSRGFVSYQIVIRDVETCDHRDDTMSDTDSDSDTLSTL